MRTAMQSCKTRAKITTEWRVLSAESFTPKTPSAYPNASGTEQRNSQVWCCSRNDLIRLARNHLLFYRLDYAALEAAYKREQGPIRRRCNRIGNCRYRLGIDTNV